MNRTIAARILAITGLACANLAFGQVAITPFSSATPGSGLPQPWKLVTVPKIQKHTRYSLVRDAETIVLRADADASMASVLHAVSFDPRQYPNIEWRWKITSVLRKADMTTKAGDDFPARLYVLFDYDIARLPFSQRVKFRLARSLYGGDIPLAALCYVWDGKSARDTSAWSVYTDRVRLIVVEGGAANAGRWVDMRRNVVEDFRAAFGEEPPPVSGIVIATDTDNTGESVSAYFGDIRFTQ